VDFDWLTFEGVNGVAVLAAFAASFILAWFWYSKAAFFPMWARLGKISDDQMKNANMAIAFGGTALFNLLGVILLAVLMAATGATSAGAGAVLGAIVGFVFRGGAHVIHNGFALRDPRITLIDVGADTAGLALAGAVLGLFG
jgi:hypothetical protein